MILVNILLSFSAVIALLLGLLIIISNPIRALNRALAALLFSIFIWLGANLLTNLSADPSLSLWFARATIIGASLIPYIFVIFSKIYTHQTNFNYKSAAVAFLAPFILIASFPTRLNIVSIGAYGKNTVTGKIYFLLVPVVVGYFAWGLIVLVKYYRRTKNAVEKAQLRYIFAGIILALIPTVIANGVLPSLGNTTAILYGPNAIIFLAVFMSLAIIKHRFLNIRLIVARSLAYVLSLLSLGALFTFTAFGFTSVFFKGSNLSTSSVRWTYTVLAVILAFILPPMRRFFDKITNHIFFRDAYDAQVFLDQFNKVLVTTYQLTVLLRKSTENIRNNLKSSFCLVRVKGTETVAPRLIGTKNEYGLSDEDFDTIDNLILKVHKKIIVVDELDNDENLRTILQEHNIAIVAKLASFVGEAGIGYLILGYKNSGNIYNSQDLNIIEIIANELVIATQNALRIEEIAHFNQTLQQKVNDATQKLRHANEKLKALDETKDDFISMASHQLRTPLTSIKGYISMVLEGDAGKISKMQSEMLGQAFFSSQRMVYLIADLLNVSRLKTGKFVIERSKVNLATLVQQELKQLKETASSRKLTLSYVQPKEFPDVVLDETKTRQVIMNFVDNAIYYTPAGGHIDVQLINNPQTIELRVVDDGIGVSKTDQAHLFTKFYRAGNARKARPDGTGLGLFMAKKVILAEEGSIIFESQEGKGSTFGFVFSKAKTSPSPS